MVTKKQRRTQLARARAQRRSERLALREARRHRIRTIAVVLAVLVAAGGLAFWIVTHDDGTAAASDVVVDYDALPAAFSLTPIEVNR